jgi:hypothetical protein
MLNFVIGCYNYPFEIAISSTFCVIDHEGVEFKLNSPIKRRLNSGSVRIMLTQDWQTLPPYTSIQLADNRLAKVKVTLISTDGRKFMSTILGRAGELLNARFVPDIPKDVPINKIMITSDVQLNCTKVVWLEYNPI